MKNKLLTALLCLIAAIALWAYVVTVVSPNSNFTYSGITLTVQGEGTLNANGFMLLVEDLPSAKLTLKGNRVDLNKISSSNINIGIDVSDISKADTYNLHLTQPTFQGNISNNAFTVLSKYPETVTVEVDERMEDDVPVKVIPSGKVPPEYTADKNNPVLDIQSIHISGPKKVVSKIKMARIDVDLEKKTQSIDDIYEITLCNDKGEPVDAKWITVSDSEVRVQLAITRVKELQLYLETIPGGGATEDDVVLTYTPATIQVSGSDAVLQKLTNLKIGTVSLQEVLRDQNFTYPIVLPEGVTSISGEKEVRVELKFKNLTTKTITVTEVDSIKAPDGMTVELFNKELDIQLRGPTSKMSNITAENIKVVVDFTNEDAGNATVNAQITVDVDGVGFVGVCPVTATIKAAE